MESKKNDKLRNFIARHMPSNAELKVKPFREFFEMLIEEIEKIPPGADINTLIFKLFGTSNMNEVDLTTFFGEDSDDGTKTLIDYIKKLYSLLKNKADLINGKVPEDQLDIKDRVITFTDISELPQPGETDKIYLNEVEPALYLWKFDEWGVTGNYINVHKETPITQIGVWDFIVPPQPLQVIDMTTD